MAKRRVATLKITNEGMKDPATRRAYYRAYYVLRRREIITLLGGKCIRCGIDEAEVLQVDHIFGGGFWSNEAANASRWYKNVIAKPSDYQLLCANCHVRKSREKGEYGHPKDLT